MPVKIFEGCVAVITGGAGGIGFAVAKHLVQRGCRIALVDNHKTRLEEAGRSLIRSSSEGSLTLHEYDVAEYQNVSRLVEEVVQKHGGVNILVNSAAVSIAGRFLDGNLADFHWIMSVNFWGTVNCCKAFLPELLKHEQAQIVNLSSSFGLLGWAGKSGYSSSKFAVRGFSEALRMELAATSVGLTVVYPGPVLTNLLPDGKVPSEEQRAAELRLLTRRAINVERVAGRIVKSIIKNPPRIRLSTDYALIDWMTRLAPKTAQTIGARIARYLPF
jgi:short-subunit dehydrogenase